MKIIYSFTQGMLLMIFSTVIFAAQPLLSIVAKYKAPSQLAPNSFTAAIYQVTNNTSSLTSFVMKPLPGVSQITTMHGACANPIQLQQGESCQLNLRIIAAPIQGSLIGGPVICNNAAQPLSCSQPSQSDSLNIKISVNPLVQNTWIKVLIAQDSPPADLATYMNQIISLAPTLDQIHFRMNPSTDESSYQTFIDLINLFRTAYSSPIQIGFHPDNSDSSCPGWGCVGADPNTCKTTGGSCVLTNSIQAMNRINTLVDPNNTNQGFNIFSLEQDDVEVLHETPEEFQQVKACLNPAYTTPGEPCPATVVASPVVTFGDVTSSYGTGYYGNTMLDYAYPQFYNLGKRLVNSNALLASYFPTDSTTCVAATDPDIYVLDVDTGNPWSTYQIPCQQASQAYPDIFTFLSNSQEPSPSLVGAYLAYLMSQLTPLSGTPPDIGTASVYVTFSGESNFFGSSGWSLGFLSSFNQSLGNNLALLNTTYHLIDNPNQIPILKYAIWNFSAMLPNE